MLLFLPIMLRDVCVCVFCPVTWGMLLNVTHTLHPESLRFGCFCNVHFLLVTGLEDCHKALNPLTSVCFGEI